MLALKSFDEMTTDPTITDAAGITSVRISPSSAPLAREFERFVAEQLDHLEALQTRIADRECQLDLDQAALHRQLENLQTAQQRLDAASAAVESWIAEAHERPPAPVPAPEQSESPVPEYAAQLAAAVAELTQERTLLGEQISSAHAQAQGQWQSLSQAAAAELAQARAELAASSEELARERQRFAEAAAPLVAAICQPPALVEQPIPAAIAPELQLSDTQLPQPTVPSPIAEERPAEPAPEPAAEPSGWWDELQQLRRGLSKSSPPPAKPGGKQSDDKSSAKNARNPASRRGTGTRHDSRSIPRPARRTKQPQGEEFVSQIEQQWDNQHALSSHHQSNP